MITKLLSMMLLSVVLFSCTSHRDPDGSVPTGSTQVTGTVAYRERIALPPDAVVVVTLQDVSRADAPAEVLGEATIPAKGRQVPIPFEIVYDPGKVVDSHRYAVRAVIRDAEGTLQWTSTQTYPVLTGGAGNRVDVLVQRTAGGAPKGSGPLEGRDWVLERFEQGGGSRPVPEGVRVTARFDDGSVAGTGGCNRYSGPFRVDAGKPTVGTIASTMMACPEPASSTERAYLDALNGATAVHVAGPRLTIVHPGGTLVFREETSVALPQTSWTVTAYNNGKQAVVSVLAGTELLLEFGDGSVAGSAGCNRFHGSSELSGESLRFGPLGSTRKMCAAPEGVMEQEDRFLAALSEVATWKVDGDRLELFRADGGRLVTATKR